MSCDVNDYLLYKYLFSIVFIGLLDLYKVKIIIIIISFIIVIFIIINIMIIFIITIILLL